MADTGIHYMAYDPDEIWSAMMDAYEAEGGDVLYGGDEKEMLLRSVLEVNVQLMASVDNALRMATLRYAQGDYLKILGENRGVPYIGAAKATGKCAIAFSATGTARSIDEGLLMTEDGATYYRTTEAISIDGAAQTAEVAIECVTAGIGGNGVAAGTAMRLVSARSDVTGVTVTAATTGGAAEEDMEVYRERIRTAQMSAVTTGPAAQYEAAAMAVSSGIVDAKAVNGGAGVVNVYLLMDAGADSAAVIAAVYEALSASDTRPLTDTVSVGAATAISYAINVGYMLPAGTGAAELQALRDAANDYIAWQAAKLGRAFDPYRLMASLYQAGATRVQFMTGSAYNGGTLEFAEVGDGEYALGTVTLEEIAT